jgi:hypothetical protein
MLRALQLPVVGNRSLVPDRRNPDLPLGAYRLLDMHRAGPTA